MLPIPSMLNYLVYNFYGVSITYWLVSDLFERRRSPLLWYAYFGLRSLIDSNLYWLTEQGEASPELTTFFFGVAAGAFLPLAGRYLAKLEG